MHARQFFLLFFREFWLFSSKLSLGLAIVCSKLTCDAYTWGSLMSAISYSRTAQAAYQDLLRLHLEETASELVGSVEERVRNGRYHLYDKFRIGTAMKAGIWVRELQNCARGRPARPN